MYFQEGEVESVDFNEDLKGLHESQGSLTEIEVLLYNLYLCIHMNKVTETDHFSLNIIMLIADVS